MGNPCINCGLVVSGSQLVCTDCYPETDFRDGSYRQWMEQTLDEYEEARLKYRWEEENS